MSNRTLTIVLAISLVVNVFIIGAAVGVLGARARYAPPAERVGPPPAGGRGGNPLMRAGDRLSPGNAQAFRQSLRQRAEAGRPRLEEAREARLEAARLLAEPRFDPAATRAAFARARAADQAAREALEDAVVQFAATLDHDQRQLLAEGLRRPPGRGGRGPGPPGGRGFPPPDAPFAPS